MVKVFFFFLFFRYSALYVRPRHPACGCETCDAAERETLAMNDGGGGEDQRVEAILREIYYYYAVVVRYAGQYEAALEAIEATKLVP